MTRTTHNVIGIIPGRNSALAEEAVVIGAHYDGLGLGGPGSLEPVPGDIHNGADDNASGVAALIELAQFFAYPTNRPQRTLVFVAFGAEEEGMLGSAFFASDPVVPTADIVAMINMDMIGRLEEALIIYGAGSSRAWPGIVAEANAGIDLDLRLMAEGYGPSDHAIFYLRQVPVLAFFTGVHEDYHRATDDAARLNIEGLDRITALVRNIVRELAEGPGRPRFDPDGYESEAAGGEPQPTAMRFRLGAVPRPTTAEGGVVIERVIAGSPASLAGIQAGDRIARVGSRTIATIYDYVRALDDMAPKRPVTIVVEREGSTITLSVIPAAIRP